MYSIAHLGPAVAVGEGETCILIMISLLFPSLDLDVDFCVANVKSRRYYAFISCDYISCSRERERERVPSSATVCLGHA